MASTVSLKVKVLYIARPLQMQTSSFLSNPMQNPPIKSDLRIHSSFYKWDKILITFLNKIIKLTIHSKRISKIPRLNNFNPLSK